MEEKGKTVLEIVSRRLDAQIEAVDSFGTRAGLVLATCGVVFAGYMQLLASDTWLSGCGSVLFIVEIALLMIAGGCAFAALVPGGEANPWHYNPEPKALLDLYEKHGESLDIARVIKSMVTAYDHNAELYKRKFERLTYARLFLYASALVFLCHLLVFFS